VSHESLILPNELTSLERLTDFLNAAGAANDWPADFLFDLNLCAEEAVVNVILHGYEDKDPHEIEVSLDYDASSVTIILEDDGIPYNPLDAKGADIYAPAEERTPGGLGVHLVRALMSELRYERAEGRNRFVMKKYIVPPTPTVSAPVNV
jgi:serine/threonine-protein kinase RsbW